VSGSGADPRRAVNPDRDDAETLSDEAAILVVCGLGIVMRSSSDWVRGSDGNWQRVKVQRTRGLNHRHNQQLKLIFKGAATTVIAQLPEEPLHGDYQKLLDGESESSLRATSASTSPR
jgi:hypothetical protein